jgi:hypothetical protein
MKFLAALLALAALASGVSACGCQAKRNDNSKKAVVA